jgi:hypothetical protein
MNKDVSIYRIIRYMCERKRERVFVCDYPVFLQGSVANQHIWYIGWWPNFNKVQ